MSTLPTLKTLRGVTVALLLAVPAAGARAQNACATGSLADYLASGFSCRIGGWTLSEFDGHAQTDADGGAQVFASDPAAVLVTPFTGTDALGRQTFGFDLAGLTTAAGAHGTTSGSEDAFGFASFGFWLMADVPGLRVLGLATFGAFDGANASPGSLRVGSSFGGGALGDDGAGGLASCGNGFASSTAPGEPPASVGGDCRVPLTGLIIVNTSLGSTARRFDGSEHPVDGFSTASLTRVELAQGAVATVPEPSSVALLAGGLAALAGVGARARRRAAA